MYLKVKHKNEIDKKINILKTKKQCIMEIYIKPNQPIAPKQIL